MKVDAVLKKYSLTNAGSMPRHVKTMMNGSMTVKNPAKNHPKSFITGIRLLRHIAKTDNGTIDVYMVIFHLINNIVAMDTPIRYACRGATQLCLIQAVRQYMQ